MTPTTRRGETLVTGFAEGGKEPRVLGTITTPAGEYGFSASLRVDDGRVVIASLTISSPDRNVPSGGITSDVLASFSTAAVRRVVEAPTPSLPKRRRRAGYPTAATIARSATAGITLDEIDAIFRWHARTSLGLPVSDEAFDLERRPGPKGRSMSELTVWLRRWDQARKKDPARTNKVLAERHGLSAQQAGKIVERLRQKGLVTKPGQGKAGGVLTPAGNDLLNTSRRSKAKGAAKPRGAKEGRQ